MRPFTHLHTHSHYSLLDGVASPARLVSRAAEVGMEALALTDHDAVYGAVEFAQAARDAGIKPLLGAEMTLAGGYHLTLLVESDRGWENLCSLISLAQAAAPKGEAILAPEALEGRTGGLIALSGCRQGPVAAALLQQDGAAALERARWLSQRFGREHFFIEVQHHFRPRDGRLLADSVALAEALQLGYVATNDVHYPEREGRRLHDVLICIKHGVPLDRSAPYRKPTSEYYLKGGDEMARLFGDFPAALETTSRIVERCQFELPTGLQAFPLFPLPPGVDGPSYLRRLCEEGVASRYGAAADTVWTQLGYELEVVERNGLVNYFLVVWDVVRFAREQGILCQGRGSACNSLVAYLLNISPIDPLAHDLVFERFLSDERRGITPDIDIDFAADRREEVIQYVYQKYGSAHVAMACTFSTFHPRSAIRDVGKALGIPAPLIEQVGKTLDWFNREALARSEPLQALARKSLVWEQLLDLSQQITGLPRHLGLHNGGMVLTAAPLSTRVPTEPAAMPRRNVVQWDKDSIEEAGLIKLDILGLRMLSMIAEAVSLIEGSMGTRIDLQRLTYDDPAVYEMIARGDTVGVFQTESGAQMNMLPRLRPTCFNDLIVAVSLIRPGPLQGNMVHPYLRRRSGEEPVSYSHPLLKGVLEETLGVVLYQEQVLKVAKELAGFTPGQGELLRRALGKKHATAALERFRTEFIRGAARKEVPESIAEEVFEQLKAFGSYSFAKSHAAAFSVIVYQSAWLKRYHHAAFSAALLNHQPMGFWSSSVLIGDARRHGVEVLPVSINLSDARCTASGRTLRMGLSYVKGLGEGGARRIVGARGDTPFLTLADFCRRTRLARRLVEDVIRAGAMDEFGLPRRRLLWELGTLHYREEEFEIALPAGEPALRPLTAFEEMAWERELLGLSTRGHVMALYREWLERQGILASTALKQRRGGDLVRVAGEVVRHQAPPTAHGTHFLTLEDEEGLIAIVVKPEVYEKYRALWRHAPLLVVEGTLQKRDRVTNVVARRVVSLPGVAG